MKNDKIFIQQGKYVYAKYTLRAQAIETKPRLQNNDIHYLSQQIASQSGKSRPSSLNYWVKKNFTSAELLQKISTLFNCQSTKYELWHKIYAMYLFFYKCSINYIMGGSFQWQSELSINTDNCNNAKNMTQTY